jgi:hypothetical protein
MEKQIREIIAYHCGGTHEAKQKATEQILNLFNVSKSVAIEEYVEHCIICRENNLPMLEWHSYQKQYCC